MNTIGSGGGPREVSKFEILPLARGGGGGGPREMLKFEVPTPSFGPILVTALGTNYWENTVRPTCQ